MKNTCRMAAEKTPPDLVAETDDLWAVEYVRRHRFGAHSRNPHPHVKSCKSDSSRIHAVPRVVAPRSAVQQHVEDVSVELSRSADRVILVGHSYAGMIISGVVEMNPTQVRRLVFLDAFIPEDEQSVLDLLPPEIGTYLRSVARDHGDGWRLPGGEEQLDLWGLKPGETRDFVRARLCDFSLRCFEEPLRLPANRKASIPSTFVSSVAEEYPARPFFAPFSAKARALGWEVAELKTGHDCHVERPGEVANIFLNE